ncbi:MAG: type II toxin-antitoxin system RelE/ParE family toxin [Aestuariivirga sp.]
MLKPLKFVGSSKQNLSSFPDPVKQDVGHSLFIAQQGGRDRHIKTLSGFHGGGVVEIIEDHDGDTFRCVYTTKLADVVVVLHAFQKKSKRGISTPKHEMDLIQSRLRDALARHWRD